MGDRPRQHSILTIGIDPADLAVIEVNPDADRTVPTPHVLRADERHTYFVNRDSKLGPLVHTTDCGHFKKGDQLTLPEHGPDYTREQIERLFEGDSALRRKVGLSVVGWCLDCTVEPV